MPALRGVCRDPEDLDRQAAKIQAAGIGQTGLTRPEAKKFCAPRLRVVQAVNSQTDRLVDADFQLEPHDLVFDVQFAALELYNFQIVGRWMGKRFVDFLFQCLMTFLEFRKMRFDRHVAASLRLITLPR
jgi:hypothetical protein